MNKESYLQEIQRHLNAQQACFPAMRQEDAVKFIFQAMLGVGHLLSSREEVTSWLAREMEGLQADPTEPLFEILSPAWCRLNLRRALAERLSPWIIAGMMLVSSGDLPFTRQEVYHFCLRQSREGCGLFPDAAGLNLILEEGWLPSHSSAYREKYHPAYRVISSDWVALIPAVQRIAEMEAKMERLFITLDGPCATGKTTLARKLAAVFQGQVLHTDDFVIPHRMKTPDRLSIPGGNCDADRLEREVAAPFKRGDPVRFQRYDFRADVLLPKEQLPPARVLILEGSYCNLPVLRRYADVRLFLEAPWEIREARLRERESPASLQGFYDRWIPLEDAYFQAYRLPDEGCIVLRPNAEKNTEK